MAKGSIYPPEAVERHDPRTGAWVRQVTCHPSIHHHPFYYLPAYDDAMRWLVFASTRAGAPQIFVEERASGHLVQVTDRVDLNDWSIHPSHDGRFVYFTAGNGAWRVDIETQREEQLAGFDTVSIREAGMVAGAMGTTTLSRDDRWWAFPVKHGSVARFHVIDTETGIDTVILERDTVCHPQFHPDDPTWLRYGGPYHDRIWVIRRDGSENRLIYRREVAKKEWIVHECWLPGTREILTSNWPHGVIGIDIDSGRVRPVCSFNAWHPMLNRTGTQMVADTKNPDRGLQLFNPRDRVGTPRTLCFPGASNAGEHWNLGHCPYDDGVKDVYAPQHTHPHPNFSPDGRLVVFTSDASGHAQVHEVRVDSEAETQDKTPQGRARLSKRAIEGGSPPQTSP